MVTALFSIGAVLSRPFIGYMLEYKSRKPLVIIGAVALLLVTVIYPLSQIVVLFLLFRFVHGLAWGWSTTVNGTAAVEGARCRLTIKLFNFKTSIRHTPS
jgi:MFS family permease